MTGVGAELAGVEALALALVAEVLLDVLRKDEEKMSFLCFFLITIFSQTMNTPSSTKDPEIEFQYLTWAQRAPEMPWIGV